MTCGFDFNPQPVLQDESEQEYRPDAAKHGEEQDTVHPRLGLRYVYDDVVFLEMNRMVAAAVALK
jgi:hypothetical protein